MWTLVGVVLAAPLSLDARLDLPLGGDPDEAVMEYAIGRLTHARGGGSVAIGGGEDWGVALAGFIELEQLARASVVPWEAYRANIGIRVARVIGRPVGRWVVDGGWFHESDHAADVNILANAYDLPASAVPNANLASGEYVRVRVARVLDRVLLRGSARVFLPNLLPTDHSRRDAGVDGEVRVVLRRGASSDYWIGGYGEVVANSYEAARPVDFRGGPYRAVDLRTGWTLEDIDVYLGFTMGNGRGVGYALQTPASLHLGLRARL